MTRENKKTSGRPQRLLFTGSKGSPGQTLLQCSTNRLPYCQWQAVPGCAGAAHPPAGNTALKSINDSTNSERRRFLLQQIHHHYRQLVEHLGKTPGDVIQIPYVVLPPLRGRFKYLSLEKIYKDDNHGRAHLLVSGLSAEQMEILLTTLNRILVQGD